MYTEKKINWKQNNNQLLIQISLRELQEVCALILIPQFCTSLLSWYIFFQNFQLLNPMRNKKSVKFVIKMN